MNELSLFTGYGGFSLGLRLAGVDTKTVCYVEIDKYCQAVLEARIADGILDEAPIWGDIKTFDGNPWRGQIDIITGGFPCPPFSVAGLRKGLEDERNLWPETLRVVREVRPTIIFLENVPGILSGYVGRGIPSYASTIVGQLAEEGYRVRWEVLGADDIGAPHHRKRWWCIGVLADSNSQRGCGRNTRGTDASNAWESSSVEATQQYVLPTWPPGPEDLNGWEQVLRHRPDLAPALTKNALSAILGVAHGPTNRVQRLRMLGNGVVPGVVATAWHLMMEYK